jgi:DDE superfamily endonuclease
MWVPWEEDDPVLWHYPGRKSVGYYGAVRLRDGKGFFRQEPGMFEGATFWRFLRELESTSREEGRRVIVITDNAKFHHAKLHAGWRDEQQGRFALDFLPAYSPELNPIERVWKRTRRNCLHNAYFAKLAMVVEKVEQQFAKWSKPNLELADLCQL